MVEELPLVGDELLPAEEHQKWDVDRPPLTPRLRFGWMDELLAEMAGRIAKT